MSNLLNISVTILDRKLSYSIRPETESLVREAVKSISARLTDLKSRYATKDNQELLSTVLLQVALDLEKIKAEDEAGHIIEEIKYLDGELDKYLEDNIGK